MLPVVLERGDCPSIAARREGLDPKVYSDLAVAVDMIVGDLNDYVEPPPTPCILVERSNLCGIGDRATRSPEEAELMPEICDRAAVDLSIAGAEWHPAERSARASGGAEARGALGLVP